MAAPTSGWNVSKIRQSAPGSSKRMATEHPTGKLYLASGDASGVLDGNVDRET